MLVNDNLGVNHTVYVINSSISPSQTGFTSCGAGADICNVYYLRFLDVFVTNSTGGAIDAATTLTYSNSSALVNNVSTLPSGYIAQQNITYAYMNNSATVLYDNHTVRAYKKGVGSASVGVNMTLSNNLTLALVNTAPQTPTLLLPLNNNNSVSERYPYFNWTFGIDAEGDDLNYTWNLSSPAGCAAVPLVNASSNEYTSVNKLCVDETYNWTVRVCDWEVCSAYATSFNFTILSSVGISMMTSTVDFGSLDPAIPAATTRNTSADSPFPLRYRNSGNVDASTQVKADAALWILQPLDTQYFQYGDENATAWTNLSGSYTNLFASLTYPNASRELELLVYAPSGEPPGAKGTTITVLGASTE